jgi:hypothetical protein
MQSARPTAAPARLLEHDLPRRGPSGWPSPAGACRRRTRAWRTSPPRPGPGARGRWPRAARPGPAGRRASRPPAPRGRRTSSTAWRGSTCCKDAPRRAHQARRIDPGAQDEARQAQGGDELALRHGDEDGVGRLLVEGQDPRRGGHPDHLPATPVGGPTRRVRRRRPGRRPGGRAAEGEGAGRAWRGSMACPSWPLNGRTTIPPAVPPNVTSGSALSRGDDSPARPRPGVRELMLREGGLG